jgi:hypothetical protein
MGRSWRDPAVRLRLAYDIPGSQLGALAPEEVQFMSTANKRGLLIISVKLARERILAPSVMQENPWL